MIDVVAIDGDDTLWHSEGLFVVAQDQYVELLAPYVDRAPLEDRLLEVERDNLRLFGYGAKGFTLSMIETAIDLSDGRIRAEEIHEIVSLGKSLLDHPVDLLEGVVDAITALEGRYRLFIITKGDLFHQESKVAQSGVADRFDQIEIVAEKDEATYRRITTAHDVDPARFVMVGNSVKSDVLPVIGIGGQAVHVPYPVTWDLERAEPDRDADGFWELPDISGLPGLIAELDS